MHKSDKVTQTGMYSEHYSSKDSLYVELKQNSYLQGDSFVIQYSIINNTQWYYQYLSDEYWIERYKNGKWVRIPNNFGSILMGKEIPAYRSINGSIRVKLTTGKYRFCNIVYPDDARIGSKEIIVRADFMVKP